MAIVLLKQARGERRRKVCNCGNGVTKIREKKRGNCGNSIAKIGMKISEKKANLAQCCAHY